MTIELKMLAGAVVLGLVHIFLAAGLATQQRGMQWNAGNRDGPAQALTGAAARAGRASSNFLETFPLFAAVVLAVVTAKLNTPHTAIGAELYLGARVAYLPIYVIGIPYLRTLVYAVSIWGFLQLLEVMF